MEISKIIKTLSPECVRCGYNYADLCQIALIAERMGSLPKLTDLCHYRRIGKNLSDGCPKGYQIINNQLMKNG